METQVGMSLKSISFPLCLESRRASKTHRQAKEVRGCEELEQGGQGGEKLREEAPRDAMLVKAWSRDL